MGEKYLEFETQVTKNVCATDLKCQLKKGLPKNTRHLAIVGSMMVHRLRRWPNIEPTIVEYLVFAG